MVKGITTQNTEIERPVITVEPPERDQKECQLYNFSATLQCISVFAYLLVYILVLMFVLNRGKLPRLLACQPASICQHP